jgi:hypothetical protein
MSNLISTCDICGLSFRTRGSFREHRQKCVRQHKSLRVTCPRSTLPRRSRHSSGDLRRPSPVALEAPVTPIDHPPQDVLGTSQSSLPPSWWLPGPNVEDEIQQNQSQEDSFDESTFRLINCMRSCKNKEGLSNADMDAMLQTLFDLVFDLKKDHYTKHIRCSKMGRESLQPKRCKLKKLNPFTSCMFCLKTLLFEFMYSIKAII